MASPVVVLETNQGNIEIELMPEVAPKACENFTKLAEKGYYNGLIFHRVIKDFMIQGGGYTADLKEKETMAPIKNEANNGLSNKRGTISMARTSEVNSATAQFFINTVDNQRLDYKSDANYGYAVFGEVTEGYEHADRIANKIAKDGNDRPTTDVKVTQITISTSAP